MYAAISHGNADINLKPIQKLNYNYKLNYKQNLWVLYDQVIILFYSDRYNTKQI